MGKRIKNNKTLKRGSDGEKVVCRLIKSFYVLIKAAFNWASKTTHFLVRQGFHRSTDDPFVFARAETDGQNNNRVLV